MKLLRKFFYSIIVTAAILIAAGAGTVVFYKADIINLLVAEVNKNIKSKLEVDKIELKLFKGFPNISINFKGVVFYSAFNDEVLLKSENIYFVLNVIDLIKNNVTIQKLQIKNAQVYIHINNKGEKNYNVFINDSTKKSTKGRLEINAITLHNVEIAIYDEVKGINDTYKVNTLVGAFGVDKGIMRLKLASELMVVKTNMQHLAWLTSKRIKLDISASIANNKVAISQSEIYIENAKFGIKGALEIDNDRGINIHISSKQLLFADLTTLLPQQWKNKVESLQGKGEININTTIVGTLKNNSWPNLKATFEMQKFELRHVDFINPIKNINIKGDIILDDMHLIDKGILRINKFSALLNEHELQGSAVIKNFKTPEISFSIKGVVEASWALSLASDKKNKANGSVKVDLEAKLKLNNELKLHDTQVLGNLVFNEVAMPNTFGLALSHLNGRINFEGNKADISNLSVQYGQSNALFNGLVELPKSNNNNRLYVKLNVESSFVNLNEILNIAAPSNDSTANKAPFPFYSVSLMLKLDTLHFNKFIGTSFKADLSLDENIININKVSTKGMGGTVSLSGSVTHQFNGDYYVWANAQTKNIDLDSLFYVFDNFNQNFITGKSLKGNLDADVKTNMYFGPDGTFRRNLLNVEALLHVRNGELNNFAPIMSLSTYLEHKTENLAELRFGDITNQIIITNDTVFIATMHVATNIRNIRIGGYHTLDQQIDYRLSVPVINTKKDNDSKFGKIKKDDSGELYFPFRIKGTTTDYKVTYDLKTASTNFIKGVGNVLLRKPPKKIAADTLVLEEEEFFDWEY